MADKQAQLDELTASLIDTYFDMRSRQNSYPALGRDAERALKDVGFACENAIKELHGFPTHKATLDWMFKQRDVQRCWYREPSEG